MADAPGNAAFPGVTREQMRVVLEVSRLLAVSSDLDGLLERIARAAPTLLSCERASVFLHDPARDELWTKVALQSDPIRVPVASGIVGHAFGSGQVVHCIDAYADPHFNPDPDRLSGFVTRDLLAAPMLDWDARPVGVLQAINKIAGAFTETDAALLRLLADQAGVAIQRWALQQEALRGSGLRHEMQLARRVQEAVIPKRPPMLNGLSCAGWARSASINGGDCYDLWNQNGRLGILVADASGHGLAPALVVSQVRALVRALADTEADPLSMLWRINDRLAADLEPGRFVTAFIGFLSPDGGLQWCSAGHGPMFRLSREGKAEVLEATLPPLGLMRQAAEEAPPPLQLTPGESLIVISDGISEAFDAAAELFGAERVASALAGLPKPFSTARIVEAIRTAVDAWQGKPEPADDQTIVVARVES